MTPAAPPPTLTGPPPTFSGPIPQQHAASAPMTPPRPIPARPYAGPPTGSYPGPQPFTGPSGKLAPAAGGPAKSQRSRWIALCAALAGVVVVALLITYLVTKDQTTQTGGPRTPVTVEPPTSSTPAPESSSPPPSTSESKPAPDGKLFDALPAVYKQYTCVLAPPPPGAAAAAECTDSNVGDVKIGNVVFRQPTGARFLRFADAAAMDAFFQDIVKTQGLTRNDAQGACRPDKYPKIWGTYYRAANPIPGEYLTCFLGDPAQLVWTEKNNLVAGILLSTKVTDNDQLDQLYQWWNTEILSDMPQN